MTFSGVVGDLHLGNQKVTWKKLAHKHKKLKTNRAHFLGKCIQFVAAFKMTCFFFGGGGDDNDGALKDHDGSKG